ncbi:hypothetical protein NL676_027400 [Syzygium grande]|nr:hypothetical protein NL676_027400 [Syzygium grande]
MTRKILNKDAVAELARKLGFKVVRTLPHTMSDLDWFTKTVSSCSVTVGVHGAWLTNEIFLPLGQDWASATYYGVPSTAIDIQYLEYKIEPEESSL